MILHLAVFNSRPTSDTALLILLIFVITDSVIPPIVASSSYHTAKRQTAVCNMCLTAKAKSRGPSGSSCFTLHDKVMA